MERILINCNECNECNIIKRHNAKLIDFNYDDIKNIINSNYITYIYYCNHKIDELANITNQVYNLSSCLKYTISINKNYLQTFNRFIVKENKETLLILLDSGIDKQIYVSTEEFISKIKKGSLINCCTSKIQKLEKILLEHNSDFIIKKIESLTFIIDTPNYTKPALVNKITDI